MSNKGHRRLDDNWRDQRAASPAEDDPLSELARLIEEDPFADFDQAPQPSRGRPARAAADDRYWRGQEAPHGSAFEDEPVDHAAPEARPDDLYAEAEFEEPAESWGGPAAEHWDESTEGEGDLYADDLAPEPELADDRQLYAEAPEEYTELYDSGAPHFDESGHMAPLVDAPPPRSRKMAMFGGLAVLAVVGGVAAFAYSGMTPEVDDGPPILVAASDGPVKVKPDDPGGTTIPNQDKVVFDRASGVTSPAKTEERIVSREEPVEAVPLRETVTTEEAAAPTPDPDAPRRVRTVVVKPDGTIVEPQAQQQPTQQLAMRDVAPPSAESVAGPVTLYDSGTSAADAAGQEPAAGTEPADSAAADAISTGSTSGATSGVPLPPARPEGAVRTAAATQTEPFVPPSAPAESTAAATPAAGQPLRLVPTPAQTSASPPARANDDAAAQVASAPSRAGNDSLPVQGSQESSDATQAAPGTTPAATGFPAGSYVVQVSSARSQEEADNAVERIKQQYGSVLSGYETTVQRADLGDRGVYYRVAVGPLADTSSASGLCGRLKSAGLDCFVRRN